MELIKKLLEAGVHFGHQTKRWNPKMERYIFGKKNGVHIIDLEKTVGTLKTVRDFLVDLTAEGGSVLFVGTKRQARDVIKEEAKRCGMFYMNYRWLGGLLTNFATIRKSIKRYKDLDTMKSDGTFKKLTKKEVSRLSKEMEKMKRVFEGILEMEHLPQVLFIVDSKSEEIAVREANKLSIPICALIDTNSDPDQIAYPIPGNDDAIKSIKLIVCLVADSIMEGRKRFLEYLGKGLVKEEAPIEEVSEVTEGDKPSVEHKTITGKEGELEKLMKSDDDEKHLRKTKVHLKTEGKNTDAKRRTRK